MRTRSIISIPAIIVGKLIRFVLRLTRSGGSALPGKIVLSFDHGFLRRMLKKLPYGIILVSGTNGKTTTTHIIRSLLETQGLRVFSNQTGSNFSRGIASELIHRASVFGNPKADIAVLELDEAYGVPFSREVRPDVSIFLNVFRDQMDRFGELENTTEMLTKIARNTTKLVVLNQDDPYIMQIKERFFDPAYATVSSGLNKDSGDQFSIDDDGEEIAIVASKQVQFAYFGVDSSLRGDFIADSELYVDEHVAQGDATASESEQGNQYSVISDDFHFNAVTQPTDQKVLSLAKTYANRVSDSPDGLVILKNYVMGDSITATYSLNGFDFTVQLGLSGLHNALNAAAALTATRAALGNKVDGNKLVSGLAQVNTAFGRGESIKYNGIEYSLILVKNPAGFRLALRSFEPDDVPVMIAINDEYADSRDTSWLYDVDHSVLSEKPNWAQHSVISGRRAAELALKFVYAAYRAKTVEPDLVQAVHVLHNIDTECKERRIYATYTAMLRIRSILMGKKGSSL